VTVMDCVLVAIADEASPSSEEASLKTELTGSTRETMASLPGRVTVVQAQLFQCRCVLQ
jgi:hypothetical protein